MGIHLLKYLLIQQMFELPVSQAMGMLLKNSEHKSAYIRERTNQDRFMMKEVWNFCLWGFEGRHSYIWAYLVAGW